MADRTPALNYGEYAWEEPTVPLMRGSTVPEMSLSTVFEVLADKQRRLVLYYLMESNGSTTVGDLVDRMLAGHGEPTDREKRLTIALHHNHLPKLENAGIIGHDAEAGRIEYREHPLIEQWLRMTQEMDLE